MRKDIDLMFLIKEHRYKVNLRDVICFQSMLRKAIQSMIVTHKTRAWRSAKFAKIAPLEIKPLIRYDTIVILY